MLFHVFEKNAQGDERILKPGINFYHPKDDYSAGFFVWLPFGKIVFDENEKALPIAFRFRLRFSKKTKKLFMSSRLKTSYTRMPIDGTSACMWV